MPRQLQQASARPPSSIHLLILTAAFAAAAVVATAPGSFDKDVEAFGAKSDSATFSGDAFNAAITACSAAGGGTVHARGGGVYIVANVQLKSHVVLSIAGNSSVIGTADASKWTREQASILVARDCVCVIVCA